MTIRFSRRSLLCGVKFKNRQAGNRTSNSYAWSSSK